MIFHIRQRMLPKRGNQWYRDNRVRDVATLCGQPVTSYDINWKDKPEPFSDKTPCPECVRLQERAY